MDDELSIVNDPRPTRADAVKNRALLLDTARQLFDAQGVESVSMSAIAEAAQVGKGTLYRHFPSKTDLCLALLDSEQRTLQEQTLQYLRDHPADTEANLRWFLGEVSDFMLRNADFLCAAMQDAPDSLQHPAHLWWRQTIRSLLAQLEPVSDVDYTADIFYVMLSITTINFQRSALGYDSARIRRGLLATLDQILY